MGPGLGLASGTPSSRVAVVAWRLWSGPARIWVIWLIAACLLILACGVFVDHPVARFVHEKIGFSRNGRRLVHIPELAMLLSLAAVVVLGLWHAYVAPLTGIWRSILFAAVSVCIATAITSALKIWFGRIPPGRWYFQQWRNFYAYLPGSFPSGHMTVMGAIAPFLWQRSRWLLLPWIVGAIAACYGLVAMEGHFVSDLIGGAAVGGSVGFAVLSAETLAKRG